LYPKNALGLITYFSTRVGVLHNPTKNYRETNTLIGVLCKMPGAKSFFA